MRPRRAWLLNLDAEEEIFRGSTYRGPYRALADRPSLAERLGGLLPEGDVLLREPRDRAEGLVGVAWSPTPLALAALSASGASPSPAPLPAALRRTMSRRFCEEVGLTLPGAAFAVDVPTALGLLREPTPSGRWLLRRSWGFAGKGRLVSEVTATPGDASRGFVERAVAEGGVLVEPWVDRVGDFSIHGWLRPDGALVTGEVCVSQVNRGGAWESSRRATADELTRGERVALHTSLVETSVALRTAGFFGPFGLDAFRYAWGGETRFNPRCDINPRYSMAWAVGMGDRRPDLRASRG